MDDKEQKPPISPQEAGRDIGFKVGGCFFVAFFWLGYSFFLSLLLGAIAGVCAGCIACWWMLADEPEPSFTPEKRKTLKERSELLRKRREKKGLLRKKK